jgi:hypothetical protein
MGSGRDGENGRRGDEQKFNFLQKEVELLHPLITDDRLPITDYR